MNLNKIFDSNRREIMRLSLGIGAFLMIGCGKNANKANNYVKTSDEAVDISSSTTIYDRTLLKNEVLVERGNTLLNAIVIDSIGKTAIEKDDGIYSFKETPIYPIYAFSGIVNSNENNDIATISIGDIKNSIVLSASKDRVATIVSTIATNKNNKTWLKESFNLQDKQIEREIPRQNKTIAAICDEVLKYCTEIELNNIAELKLNQLKTIEESIHIRIDTYNSKSSSATHLEKMLCEEIGSEFITEEEKKYYEHGSSNPVLVINQLPKYTLNDEQKYALAFMWNEERLAGDAYGAFYKSLYPKLTDKEKTLADRVLKVIHKAERLHEQVVEALIEKYDIDILNLDDYDGKYNKEELKNMPIGTYPIKKLQEVWDNVAPIGTKSLEDAFKIGAITEVGDIEDLDRYIKESGDALDYKFALEFLRDGSILHYWVFDKALKELGIPKGACAISSRFCLQSKKFRLNGDGGTGKPLLKWVEN